MQEAGDEIGFAEDYRHDETDVKSREFLHHRRGRSAPVDDKKRNQGTPSCWRYPRRSRREIHNWRSILANKVCQISRKHLFNVLYTTLRF